LYRLNIKKDYISGESNVSDVKLKIHLTIHFNSDYNIQKKNILPFSAAVLISEDFPFIYDLKKILYKVKEISYNHKALDLGLQSS